MAKTNESPMPVKAEIQDLIYVIRGQQVMIDKDLAALYGVETKRLNEQVKRNIKRFPKDFMFQPTQEECLRSQIATSNDKGRGGNRYTPYVFTENGVAMLSGILRSDTAIEVNIQIMRAFTKMRHFLANNATMFNRMEAMEYHQLEMQKHQDETDKRLDIDRHNTQYRPIEVKTFRLSHDRFLCIDESVYHIGASIKDLGKKWFGFSKMELLSPDELVERINRS